MKDLLDDQPRHSFVRRRRLERSLERHRRAEAGLRALGIAAALAGLFGAVFLPLPILTGPGGEVRVARDCAQLIAHPECIWARVRATPSPTPLASADDDGPEFVEALRFFPEASDWVRPPDP